MNRISFVMALLVGVFFSSLAFAGQAGLDRNPLIFLPFGDNQEVYCVQGNDGHYSHYGTQHYAYDFDMEDSRNSDENPIFNIPIYSPVSGTIAEIRDGVVDFTNNSESNSANNFGWGNTLVISVNDGEYFIRVAHMKHNSIPSSLEVGSWVEQGDLIGRVGQTGYSSHPHLHIQMQESVRGDSIPFDFVEGNLETGEWAASMLQPNLFVVDSDRRTNLSAPLANPNMWWRLWNYALYNAIPDSGSIGDDYYTSQDSNARFFWGFNILFEGRYDVYASCRGLSNRDPNAYYRVYRNGIDWTTRVDQRELNADNWAYLGTHNFREGYRYYVQVQRSSGRVCADAIFLRYVGD